MRPEPAAVGNLFGREDAVNADRCLNCATQYDRDRISMWPMATQEEYCLSGLCRKCQAVAFDEDLTMYLFQAVLRGGHRRRCHQLRQPALPGPRAGCDPR